LIKRLPLKVRLRRFARDLLHRMRRPRRVTCLDCGYLSFGGAEATGEDRVILAERMAAWGNVGISLDISLDTLRCFRSLWLEYRLLGGGDEVILSELDTDRRGCRGFDRHRPGFTPSEHLDLLSKRWEARRQFWLTVLGSAAGATLALLVAWLTWWWGIK
jgi:hypothetical protein